MAFFFPTNESEAGNLDPDSDFMGTLRLCSQGYKLSECKQVTSFKDLSLLTTICI